MATRIAFIPSDGNYRITVPLEVPEGTKSFAFDIRWNERDSHWYFDMYDPEGILMVAGVKVVLNVPLGRRSTHPFFTNNSIVALDTTLLEQDPGFDDINDRVIVWHLTESDLIALRLVI